MAQLHFELGDRLHHQFKALCAQQGISMAEALRDMVKVAITQQEHGGYDTDGDNAP